MLTQYQTHNTWNFTEGIPCTLICPLTGPTTNHCPGNGLGHLQIVERPNVHIISLQLVIHDHTCQQWLIATEPDDRILTHIYIYTHTHTHTQTTTTIWSSNASYVTIYIYIYIYMHTSRSTHSMTRLKRF